MSGTIPSHARRSADTMVSMPRTGCRVCGERLTDVVLNLGNQYLPNFVLQKDETLPRAPLELVRCVKCGLMQLSHTTNPNLLYRTFWYRTGINHTMRDAMRDIVRQAMTYHPEGTWLDIGANDGYLLSLVPTGRFRRIACEPALNFEHDLKLHSDVRIMDYFNAEHDCLHGVQGHGACDIITSAAMFYDVDDPNRFVADIVKCLKPNGIWVNQLSDTVAMMQRTAFDNICHEHLCYYDVPTLKKLYDQHGLKILSVSFNEVNGGSMRVVAALKGASSTAGCLSVEEPDVWDFANRARRWKELMTDFLLDTPSIRNGDTWLYGASTKGMVLLQYLDLNEKFISVADRNPEKHGLIMAGAWIPITDELTMRRSTPSHLMVLPWAFREEFIQREHDLRAKGTVMIMPLPNPEFVL